MIVASTWIGFRFSPAVGGVYSLVLSAPWRCCAPQAGRARSAPSMTSTTRAIVVQVYVLVTDDASC